MPDKKYDFSDIVEQPKKSDSKFDFSDIVEKPVVETAPVKPVAEVKPSVQGAEGMTGGKYDLSQLYSPQDKSIQNTPEQNQIETKAKLKEQFKPEAIKRADKKLVEINNNISTVSNEWNTSKAHKTLLEDKFNDPMTSPEEKLQIQEAYPQIEAQEKADRIKAVGLQKSKSTLNKIYEVNEKLTGDVNDDALKATGNMLTHIYNAIPETISGAGSFTKSVGDVVFPDNQLYDIIGNGIKGMGDDLKSETDAKYDDKHYITSTIGDIVGSIAVSAIPGGMVGKAGKVASMITGATTSTMQMADGIHEKAKAVGLTDKEAGMMTLSVAPIAGLLEVWGASNIIDGIAGKKALNELIDYSVKNLAGKTVTRELVFNTVGDGFKEIGKKYGLSALKSAGEEGLTEGLQGELEAGAENLYDITNEKKYGTKLFSTKTQLDIAQQAAIGAVAGSVFGALAGISKPKDLYTKAVELSADPSKFERFKDMLNTEVEAEHITDEQAITILDNINSIIETDKKIPPSITDKSKRVKAVNLITERNSLTQENEKLTEEAKGFDEAFSLPQQEKIAKNKTAIDEINSSLKLLATGGEKVSMKRKDLTPVNEVPVPVVEKVAEPVKKVEPEEVKVSSSAVESIKDETIKTNPLFYTRRFDKEINESHSGQFVGKDGNTYYIKKEINGDTFKVYDKDLKQVGVAVFDASKNDFFTGYEHNQSIQVDESFRRKGIASAMTDFAEKLYDKPYKPSSLLSPEMQGFVNKRKPKSEAKVTETPEDVPFDFESLFAEETPEQKAENEKRVAEETAKEKQDNFDKLGFSKKWATTPEEAQTKLVKQYEEAKAKMDDWAGRVYKDNKDVVEIGAKYDEYGSARSIGSINEGRRNRNIESAKGDMKEAIEDLKRLGLSKEQIEEIIQPKSENSKGFTKKGGNKLVDEKGEPEVVYHGTKVDFKEFDDSKKGSTDEGWFGKGFYFHSDPNRGGYGGIVKAANINLQNPIELPVDYSGKYLYDIIGEKAGLDKSFRDKSAMSIIKTIGSDKFTELAKELGYDGVVSNYAQGTKEIVAFDKSQIKIVDKVKSTEVVSEKPVSNIKALEEEYNGKSVDELVALKKKKYPNPDIESAMSPEEKLLNKVIAQKFSDINEQVRLKRETSKSKGKQVVKITADEEQELTRLEFKKDKNRISEQDNLRLTNLKQKQEDGKNNRSTENGSDQEANDSPEEKKAKRIRAGNRIPKAKRKLSKKAILALKVESVSIWDDVLKYFINKGTLHPSAIQELYGDKNGKSVQEEMNARLGILNGETGKTINEIAHQLWESQDEGNAQYETMAYREAVEYVLNKYNSTGPMMDHFLKREKIEEPEMSPEEMAFHEWRQQQDIEEEFADDAFDIWENLTEAEKEFLVNDAEASVEPFIAVKTAGQIKAEKEYDSGVIDLEEQLLAAKKAKQNKLDKLTNSAQLFGDEKKSDELLGVEQDLSQENIDAQMKPFNDKIKKIEKETKDFIDNKEKFLKKYDGQVEIPVEVKKTETVGKQSDLGSASSRFRPMETVVFEKPIVGPNGTKLTSYTWAYEWTQEPSKRTGEFVDKRKSDWSQAQSSAETGRDVVHQFTIQTADGRSETVSSESVPVKLGYVDAKQMKNFPSLANAVKTLSKQRMQLSILEAKQKEYDLLVEQFKAAEKPKIVEGPSNEGFLALTNKEGRISVYSMGEVEYHQPNDHSYNDGKSSYTPKGFVTKETKEELTQRWIDKKVKEAGGERAHGIYDLQSRIKRQEKKVEDITGGKVSIADKAADLAAKIRESGKYFDDKTTSLPPGVRLAWKAAHELVALSVEGGAVTIDAINKAIEKAIKAFKETDYIKGLSAKNQADWEADLRESLDEIKEKELTPKPSGIKKALVPEGVEANMDKLSSDEILAMGKDLVESKKIIPKNIVTEILDNKGKSVLEPREVSALIYYKAVLDGDLKKAYVEKLQAIENNSDTGSLDIQISELKSEIYDYNVMSLITARQQSLAFNLRKGLRDSNTFDVVNEINQYKAANEGVIPADVKARFEAIAKELEDLKDKIAQMEVEKEQAEEKRAFDNIAEEIARENKPKVKGPGAIKEKTNQLSELIRKGKVKRPDVFSASAGAAVWDAALELISKTVDAGGSTFQAIHDAGVYIKESDWYKSLSKEKQKEATDGFNEAIGYDSYQPKMEKGRLVLPSKLIRDYVKAGVKDINELTTTIHAVVLEQFPNVTEREVRDAITGYGKTVNKNKTELAADLSKLKMLGKLISKREDLEAGKIPIAARVSFGGKSLVKISDYEKELKIDIKNLQDDLGITEDRKVKAATKATEASILEIYENIHKQELEFKAKKHLTPTPELIALREQLKVAREKLKAERDKAGITASKENETATKRVQKMIDQRKDALATGNFPKTEQRGLNLEDTPLNKLKAQSEKLMEEVREAQYRNEMNNRTIPEVLKKDTLKIIGGLLRGLTAGLDFGATFVQGGSRALIHPIETKNAFIKSLKAFGSTKKSEDFLNNIKSQDWYPMMKASGLQLLEDSYRTKIQEEQPAGNIIGMVWNLPANVIEKAFGKNAVSEFWKNADVYKAAQRAYVTHVNYIRVSAFLKLAAKLEHDGINLKTDKKRLKALGDFVNTQTGRASLGKYESSNELAASLFFSVRRQASAIKMLSPFSVYYYGSMPSSVRKHAIIESIKSLTAIATVAILAQAAVGDDDDWEEFFDSNSANFLSVKIHGEDGSFTSISLLGPMKSLINVMSRVWTGGFTSSSTGEKSKLGERYGKPINTEADAVMSYIMNKLSPFYSLLLKAGSQTEGNELDYGDAAAEASMPMWANDASELFKDHPGIMAEFLTALNIIGMGATHYKSNSKKKEDSLDRKIRKMENKMKELE